MNVIDKTLAKIEENKKFVEAHRGIYQKAYEALKSVNQECAFEMFGIEKYDLWCYIFPKSKKDMLTALRALSKAGIRKCSKGYMNGKHLGYDLKNDSGAEINLLIDMKNNKTCKIVKTGEEIQPVYEVICD